MVGGRVSPVWLGRASRPHQIGLIFGGASGGIPGRAGVDKEGGLLMGFFRPSWKRTAVVLPPVALIIGLTLALTGAFAAGPEPLHGIGFSKGCTSPTAIGNPYACSYAIQNTIDEAEDTLTIHGLKDIVHAAPQPGGDVSSGNILGTSKLDNCSTKEGACTQTEAKCEGKGLTGVGTRAEPWQNVEMCTLPFGSRVNVESSSQYTVKIADFEQLEKHILKDTAELEWKDTCNDPKKSGDTNCNPDPPPNNGGTSATLVEPVHSKTATKIHNAAHSPV